MINHQVEMIRWFKKNAPCKTFFFFLEKFLKTSSKVSWGVRGENNYWKPHKWISYGEHNDLVSQKWFFSLAMILFFEWFCSHFANFPLQNNFIPLIISPLQNNFLPPLSINFLSPERFQGWLNIRLSYSRNCEDGGEMTILGKYQCSISKVYS